MRSILTVGLFLVAAGFVVYALWTYYGSQPTTQSPAKRAMGAILAALVAAGGALMALFQSPAGP